MVGRYLQVETVHVLGGWENWLGQHKHRYPLKSAGRVLIPSRQRHYERDRELLGSAVANDHRGRDSLYLLPNRFN